MSAAVYLTLLHMTLGIIGTGIDARQGLFIQEFHQGDKVKYLLANTATKPAEISVVKFDESWRIGQPIGKVIAGPWEIPAKGTLEVDVGDLAGEELIRFFNADKSPLGVLNAPRKPTAKTDEKARTAAGGLNGLGNYVDGVSMQFPAAAVKAGEEVTVRITFSSEVRGLLKFTPLATPNAAAGPKLHPEKVTANSVPVRQEGKIWVIDLNKPTKAEDHVMELTFKVPADHAEPIFVCSAWLANDRGGGVTLARAVEVKPAAK
ncbi:hypothetical protein [Anatilimnocola floriformis]|uniref:hypothetical protein n=1 Tax=Anatilimnocola floriformis TaxID=2948575 RepID=UPI0020C37057|nr:hypothetical protein [Anatilimnocola floriformis]